MTNDTDFTLDVLYGAKPPAAASLYGALGQSQNPRPGESLYKSFKETGIKAEGLAVDVGCRDAAFACNVVKFFKCRVIGIDPVDNNLRNAQAKVKQQGVVGQLDLLRGALPLLPLKGESCDAIWCSDVMTYAPDLRECLDECARVLKPGGGMMLYQTLAGESMTPAESEWLFTRMGGVPRNHDQAYFEGAIKESRFEIQKKDVISSEFREYFEETGNRMTSLQLLRMARMLRKRDALIAESGPVRYEAELAECYWGVWQMMGKLCPVVYVLKKPA
ncbi:MAG: class I SAM-dependent methyltransferase [Planctomycetaceae bacterium]|nr:class I SAM-dependent methyltransferase [Planctomycetaceae bacterium]